MFREQRFLRKTEVRVASTRAADSIGTLTGYAAKFNRKSSDLGGFYESIQPGAFDASLKTNPDVKFLRDHSPTLIMGRTKSGTLRLSSDSVGLKFSVDLPDTSQGRDLLTLVKRGDVTQCSFAFTVNPNGESWRDNLDDDPDLIDDFDEDADRSLPLRKLTSVNLMDVSAVTYPAYSDTEVNADPVQILGRSLFPEGIPVEIRSRIPNIRTVRATTTVDKRRALVNTILGL